MRMAGTDVRGVGSRNGVRPLRVIDCTPRASVRAFADGLRVCKEDETDLPHLPLTSCVTLWQITIPSDTAFRVKFVFQVSIT